ncbi:MAG: sensor histidine kinase [Gemmatimonadetes bacterium]|nr:sensor histidine kinase [Gemmatimonadota bacterium]
MRKHAERKRADQELRESEERQRAVFKGIPVPTYVWKKAGDDFVLADYNDAAETITHGGVARSVGSTLTAMYGDYAPDIARDVARCHAERATVKRQMRYRFRSTGETRDLAVTYGFVPPDTVVVHTEDVTERAEAETALRESRAQLRELAGRVRSARERERASIARQIHDVLGQALTALKLDIAWLQDRLPTRQRAELAEKIRGMLALVNATIEQARTLVTELRPAILDDLGLLAAIEWETQEFARRSGLRCDLDLPAERIPLDAHRATDVYRILQEALTNVARHARAQSVQVSLRLESGELVLDVRDDGRGITDGEIADPRALGLLGMRERALVWGGEVAISPALRGGTFVQVRIPCAP